ncbi:MAG: hypothetical protein JWN70_334 [Planctomycetaceae bacterium]|nr:hypothetical protein [Planctomycetaceae bacterium]
MPADWPSHKLSTIWLAPCCSRVARAMKEVEEFKEVARSFGGDRGKEKRRAGVPILRTHLPAGGKEVKGIKEVKEFSQVAGEWLARPALWRDAATANGLVLGWLSG